MADQGQQTEPSLKPAWNGGTGASLRQDLGQESLHGKDAKASLGHGGGSSPRAAGRSWPDPRHWK